MPNARLIAHTQTQFKRSITRLAPGLWTAVGFSASTQHMIEGDHSVTIIDTSESTGAAEQVLNAFREHCPKPVGRIIYTHSHRDHVSGASVFTEGRDVEIVASALFSSDLIDQDPDAIAPNKALARRTMAQFGIGLTPQERISLGCGPGERPMEGLGAGFVPPNRLISGDVDMDLDGVAVKLIHAPGETADHMVVWVPEHRVLFPGDNWYHAFPNLYAIRGTAYRDFAAWAESLMALAELQAEVLAPGHTLPVFGERQVYEVLTTTRDAILHLMRHTADGMDAGLPLDDIVATLTLPSHLANKPWLGEFYGKAGWSARAFASGTLGWYDGNPTHLGTLPSAERAKHVAALAGGEKGLWAAAEQSDDLQWRLELCDHLLALGAPAQVMKAEAMEQIAEDEINATARNTYLWEAKRLRSEAEK